MAGNEGSMAKICSTCGTDCTNKPRVKDASGNYMCKPCAEKAAGAKPSPGGGAAKVAAAPASEPNIMAKLVDDSLKQAQGACPACRKKLKEGALICTNCGFNSTTGQMVQTAVQTPQMIVDKSAKKVRRKIRLDPGISVLVALGVFGGLFAISMVEPAFVFITLVIVILYQFAVMLLVTINAFQDGDIGWGAAGIVSFFVGCVWLAMIYYIWMVTEREYLKGLWLIGFISYVFAIVMYVTNQQEVVKAMQEFGIELNP